MTAAASESPGAGPLSVSDARELSPGTQVTVAGWVTVTDEFLGPMFMQDEEAGIAELRIDSYASHLEGAPVPESGSDLTGIAYVFRVIIMTE